MQQLNLLDLLEKSQQNEVCLNEAREVFKANYSQSQFHTPPPFKVIYEKPWISNGGESLILVNFMAMKEILNNFGDLIQNLTVNFKEFDTQSEGRVIVNYINDKNCGSFERLSLQNVKENVLNDLQENTCKRITTLRFSTSDRFEFVESRKLNELFPGVEYLDVECTNPSCWAFITERLTNLRTFHMDFSPANVNAINETHITNFLKNNVRIENLRIYYTNLMLLKEVNEILPNLETLEISLFSDDYLNYPDIVQFNNVKNLRMDYYGEEPRIPERIFFNQLQQFHLATSLSNFIDKWFEFIDNQVNRNLTTFILATIELEKEQLFTIPEKFPDLQTLIIECWSKKIRATEIISFMKKNKHLITLKMSIQIDGIELKKLQKVLENRWNVEFTPYDLKFIGNYYTIHISQR